MLETARKPSHQDVMAHCSHYNLTHYQGIQGFENGTFSGCLTESKKDLVWFVWRGQKKLHWRYQQGTYRFKPSRSKPESLKPGLI
ncbi:hypothetical protein [Synechococcus sp. MIT S9451]|uniref:hypothetical protein n=1 Tax=Synechococcus sp. MIT S9451 TaxID=3082543 RepID=UPI0039B4CF3E